MQAVLDPYINAMHVALLRQRRPSEEAREWFAQLRQRLLREGPAAFSNKEKMALLLDAESMIWLHRELWTLPRRRARRLVARWRCASTTSSPPPRRPPSTAEGRRAARRAALSRRRPSAAFARCELAP